MEYKHCTRTVQHRKKEMATPNSGDATEHTQFWAAYINDASHQI